MGQNSSQTLAVIVEDIITEAAEASMQPKQRAELLREQEKYLEYHKKVKKERAQTKNS